MAEALTRTAGFVAKPASVSQSSLVPRTRLSRILSLNAVGPAVGGDVFAGEMDDGVDARKLGRVDHAAVGIPANFMSRRRAAHGGRPDERVGRRPPARLISALPTKPLEPVMAMIIRKLFSCQPLAISQTVRRCFLANS